MTVPAHLYFHIPFCQRRCPYCGFASVAGRKEDHATFVTALLYELARLPTGPYETMYIGGGTPTVLTASLLARLLDGIRQHCRLAHDYEWTCEANPGSGNGQRLAILAEHGVNRLSVGIQSTHPHHLRTLGRIHTPVDAERCLERARSLFARLSADLIFGLPAQTLDEVETDLTLCTRHQLDHASIYGLSIEADTPFARCGMTTVDDDTATAMFALIRRRMRTLGVPPYETSSYARPGQESRHNLATWHQRDYQACGAGAVSTVDGVRIRRIADPADYSAAILAGGDAHEHRERLGSCERIRECWMLGLRLEAGVDCRRLTALGDPPERWAARAEQLIADGLLIADGCHLRLSEHGRPVQDAITARLMP